MQTDLRKRILIVEDERDTAKLERAHLISKGYDVHTETYGSAALTYAADHRPDLVILDLKLPDISGLEVCRELRTLYRPWTVPIVMVTAMDRPAEQVQGFTSGANVYLTKPCELTEIENAVAFLLDANK